jgi:hypothetical protein
MVTPQKVSEKFESQATKGLYNFIFSAEKLDKDKMSSYLAQIEKLMEMWTIYTGCILDIYFLGRMFKPPKDNTHSFISLGFFGYHHADSISDFICKDKQWYTVR